MCDLGTDEILIYRIENGHLIYCPEKTVSVPAGYGVRHLAFSKDGTMAYVITELSYRVLTYRYDGNGNFEIVHDQLVCADLPEGEHSGGAIRVCREMLYCTNRGPEESRIDWLRIDRSGIPVPAGHIHTGCKCPRDIVFTPDNRHLLCANQKGNTISVYAHDETDGSLTYLTSISCVPSPCCILIE